MNKNKLLRPLAIIAGTTLLTLATSSVALAGQVLEYKLMLAEDGDTYEVWMRPSENPSPDISLTGQVTLKAPSSAAFKTMEVLSVVPGSDWVEASRVDSPEEDEASDYISFSFVGLQGDSAHNYQWQADEEKLVFTFRNEGGCVEGVSLMAHDDPFNNKEGNSANTNPGNQFTNLGWGGVGENNFKGLYGEAISCP